MVQVTEDTERRWAKIIAESIESNLDLYHQGRIKETDFVGQMVEQDPLLNAPDNVRGLNLSAAWIFGDLFFDAVSAGDWEIGGLTIAEAATLLAQLIEPLRQGREIKDPQIMCCFHPHCKPSWWKRFLSQLSGYLISTS